MYPELGSDSCIAQTLGLGAGEVIQLRGPGATLRVGSTLAEVLDAVRGLPDLEEEPIDDVHRELLFLRGSTSVSGRPRAHFLLDQMGNRLHVGWSVSEAIEVLERTITTLQISDGVLLNGPALVRPRGAVAIHPAFREVAIDAVRTVGHAPTALLLPSAAFALHGTSLVARGRSTLESPLCAVVLPDVESDPARFCQLLQVARRWDDLDLATMQDLLGRVPCISLPTSLALGSLLAEVDAQCGT